MGTTFSVVLWGADRATLESSARAALDEAQRIDRLLSNYQPASELSRVNRDAARQPVAVSRELFDVIEIALRYSRESDGAFDMSVGALMKTWGFYKGEGRLPETRAIETATSRVGYPHIALDRTARTVKFDVAGLELDPGGIGKGYAVDRMAALLKRARVKSALISAGGSSIYGIGSPPDEPRGWKVPIRSPDGADRAVAEVFLKDMSVSTSGGYEKFFRADGGVYAHIMDPRTGYPASASRAVSVVAPSTTDSEVWAKPYFINGRAWTAAHVRPRFRVFHCDATSCEWISR